MKTVLVFNINGTLLDMSSLRPLFDQHLHDANLLHTWMAHLLHSTLVINEAGFFVGLSTLAESALEQTADEAGVQLSPHAQKDILGMLNQLPPYPDTAEGLEMLRTAGFRIAALSNASVSTLRSNMEHSGLAGYFEQLMSIDAVRRYKPASEPYHFAAETLEIPVSEFRMIAAHDWDVLGALNAGCHAAFLARPGRTYSRPYTKPDMVAGSLTDLAEKLIAAEQQSVAAGVGEDPWS